MSALAVALAMALSGCGRKGPLDPPPGAQLVEPSASGQAEFDAQGRPIAPTGQKRRLPIDVLLD